MRDREFNSWITGIGCLLLGIVGLAQLCAGIIGIEHQFGWIGLLVACIILAFGIEFPFLIGTYICCAYVWKWPWPLALLFTLPGLIFLIPSVMAAVFSIIPWNRFSKKKHCTSSPQSMNGSFDQVENGASLAPFSNGDSSLNNDIQSLDNTTSSTRRISQEPSIVFSDDNPNVNENLNEDFYTIGKNALEKNNFLEAVKWFRKAAEQGDARAKRELGFCYQFGRGVAQDITEAMAWQSEAAEQGDAEAQMNVAMYYTLNQNYLEAAKWHRKAAEQGESQAQTMLGMWYQTGLGVKKDYTEAFKWFHRAADQGDADAQWHLANCYTKGWGVEIDVDESAKWIRKAARQGHKQASYVASRIDMKTKNSSLL